MERGFHDVTIVDMGNLPEPSLSLDDLSQLRLQWPVMVPRSMMWLQQDLDSMCVAANKCLCNSRLGNCFSCGKWIKCDMYRHVATYHLDLGQLWWCPVSWCTLWKGMPQDCMDHIRGAHHVPWDIKSASLEKFLPLWTVKHQIWTDALKPCHSGVSTDVLLFSDINISLAHYYRVFRLPHLAFQRDYPTCLRVFVSQATALAQCDMTSPVPPSSSSVSARHARSSEVESESPRKTRRARRRMRPTRV